MRAVRALSVPLLTLLAAAPAVPAAHAAWQVAGTGEASARAAELQPPTGLVVRCGEVTGGSQEVLLAWEAGSSFAAAEWEREGTASQTTDTTTARDAVPVTSPATHLWSVRSAVGVWRSEAATATVTIGEGGTCAPST